MNNSEKFYPIYEEPDFRYQHYFEMLSMFGRIFLNQRSKIIPSHSPLLLDIGQALITLMVGHTSIFILLESFGSHIQ
jgi:hypothetical protein